MEKHACYVQKESWEYEYFLTENCFIIVCDTMQMRCEHYK